MGTRQSKHISILDYFPGGEGKFMWHRAMQAILERWDETNKLLGIIGAHVTQINYMLSDAKDTSYKEGFEDGKKEAKL